MQPADLGRPGTDRLQGWGRRRGGRGGSFSAIPPRPRPPSPRPRVRPSALLRTHFRTGRAAQGIFPRRAAPRGVVLPELRMLNVLTEARTAKDGPSGKATGPRRRPRPSRPRAGSTWGPRPARPRARGPRGGLAPPARAGSTWRPRPARPRWVHVKASPRPLAPPRPARRPRRTEEPGRWAPAPRHLPFGASVCAGLEDGEKGAFPIGSGQFPQGWSRKCSASLQLVPGAATGTVLTARPGHFPLGWACPSVHAARPHPGS